MATRFIREKKDRDFSMINNTFIKDSSLSWKAKGLMAYLLSLPDDWVIHLSEIEKHAIDGNASLRSAIKELIEHGYLKSSYKTKDKEKKEDGTFAEINYTIIEKPVKDSPFNDFPHAENPHAENPHAENPHAENRILLNTNKQITDLPITDEQNTDGQNLQTGSLLFSQKEPSEEELINKDWI